MGFQVDAEVLTSDGRIDAVIKNDTSVYIIEFKAGQSAQKAIDQIKEKEYANKYLTEKRAIILFGINFNVSSKRIDDYIIEEIN